MKWLISIISFLFCKLFHWKQPLTFSSVGCSQIMFISLHLYSLFFLFLPYPVKRKFAMHVWVLGICRHWNTLPSKAEPKLVSLSKTGTSLYWFSTGMGAQTSKLSQCASCGNVIAPTVLFKQCTLITWHLYVCACIHVEKNDDYVLGEWVSF